MIYILLFRNIYQQYYMYIFVIDTYMTIVRLNCGLYICTYEYILAVDVPVFIISMTWLGTINIPIMLAANQ